MDIPRPEKILVAMYQLSNGTNLPLEYEDIVVKSWQLFPDKFGLRKYVNQYPDSSDQHKPLYGPLKDRGFVLSGNKKFRLTQKGIAYASELEKVWKGLQPFEQAASANNNPDRLSRDKEAQLKRICETEAFKLFAAGEKEKILDPDFYTYLGVTVRTKPHDFIGRLQTVADAVAGAVKISFIRFFAKQIPA
ncbi:MAG: hypothetical protein KGJ60_07505 [Verrucomicrobiota bacterium]|nr:hypothetical protein [Verrucomicrobiota bacterium]